MTSIEAVIQAAADSIDPAPITAWLLLVVALLTIIGGVCAGIGFGWKWIVKPQVELLLVESIEERATVHRAVHAALDARIEAEARFRGAAIAKVHERIDKHIAEQH